MSCSSASFLSSFVSPTIRVCVPVNESFTHTSLESIPFSLLASTFNFGACAKRRGASISTEPAPRVTRVILARMSLITVKDTTAPIAPVPSATPHFSFHARCPLEKPRNHHFCLYHSASRPSSSRWLLIARSAIPIPRRSSTGYLFPFRRGSGSSRLLGHTRWISAQSVTGCARCARVTHPLKLLRSPEAYFLLRVCKVQIMP